MEKIIKFTIENTTKTREVEDTYSELYSHDRNNGLFEFEIANEQLAGKNLIALFKFVKTGSYWKTEAVVEDNKAKIKFDTSLITQNEKVICFIYVNEEIRDADIFRFKFNVRVSEIDKAKQLPLKERFYAHGLIVDRVDVLTKEDFDKAIKEIEKGSKFLTEAQANEKYALKGDIPNVSNFVSDTQLSDYALKTEIPNSETIVNKAVEEVEKKGYLTEHQSLAGYVTETQLEGKNYLTEHQDVSGLVTKEQLKKAFLDDEEHEKYAKKTELPQPYNDTDIKSRLTALEGRPAGNVDTSEFVTNRVYSVDKEAVNTQISRKLDRDETPFTFAVYGSTPYEFFQKTTQGNQEKAFGKIYCNRNERIIISGIGKYTNLDTALYTLTTAIPDGYTPDFEFGDYDNVKLITNKNISNYLPSNTGNTTELDNRLKVLEAKQWEIHGRGMPNGVVTAPVGTTYVDEAVTNGALKWIKKTGTGNTGWEVLIGDTGWKIIPSVSKLGNSFVKIRRVNNVVSYQFGGLSWGWFGIVRRGGAGYVLQGSDRERNCYIIQNGGIPIGYRAEASLIGNIYNDKGVPYGTWYLGGNGDYNQLRFQFTDPVPTDRDIGDIRISSISYLTSDPWPQN